MACGASANGSGRACSAYTPVRLIQPARCVVTATAAETVTLAARARGLVERREDRRETVAADVGHERGQRVVQEAGEGAIEVGVERAVGRADKRLAHGARRQPQQPLILAARHRLEAAAQPLTARTAKRGLEPPAPPQLAHAPAVGAEEIAA